MYNHENNKHAKQAHHRETLQVSKGKQAKHDFTPGCVVSVRSHLIEVPWMNTLLHFQALNITLSGSRHGEVNTRLVRLVDTWCVPVHLNDTITGFCAMRAEIFRHFHSELLPALFQWDRGESILVPLLEILGNDLVALRAHDRDVGVAGVRSLDVEVHWDLLARTVLVHIVLVVGELHALALPEVTGLCVIVRLVCNDLLETLNVAVDLICN